MNVLFNFSLYDSKFWIPLAQKLGSVTVHQADKYE